MGNNKVAIFWTDEDASTLLLSELLEGRLRQGWGAPGMELTERGKKLPLDRWCQNCSVAAQKEWNWNPTLDWCKTRYSILSRMVDFERVDLVVVPRTPSLEEFCIARVTDGYYFDTEPFERDDLRHIVRVDKASLRNYRFNTSSEAAAIAAKFRYYRSAVNNVQDYVFAKKIWTLFTGDLS